GNLKARGMVAVFLGRGDGGAGPAAPDVHAGLRRSSPSGEGMARLRRRSGVAEAASDAGGERSRDCIQYQQRDPAAAALFANQMNRLMYTAHIGSPVMEGPN